MIELAANLLQLLRERHQRIVFAESCTAGLAAATLGQIPGVSEVLCGSQVVYQTATKADWLGIDPLILADPTRGPVSVPVTFTLAQEVLKRTPNATVAAAITGHLGPLLDQESISSVVFICICFRGVEFAGANYRLSLSKPSPSSLHDYAGRAARQAEAVELLYKCLIETLHVT